MSMAKELNTKTSTASSSATSPEKHIKKKVIKKVVKKEAEEVKPQPKKVIKKKIIKKIIKKVPASSISGATGPVSAAGIDATISPVSPLASAQPQGAVQAVHRHGFQAPDAVHRRLGLPGPLRPAQAPLLRLRRCMVGG